MVWRSTWCATCAGAVLAVSCMTGCGYTRVTLHNPFAQVRRSADAQFEVAQQLEREGKLPQAESKYRELADEHPLEAKYQHRLGVVQVRQGQLDDGIATLKAAEKLDSDNSALLNDLGYACILQGDFRTAADATRRALVLNPRDARARNSLALALGFAGDTQEALAVVREGLTEREPQTKLAIVQPKAGDSQSLYAKHRRTQQPTPEIQGIGQAVKDARSAVQDGTDLQLVSDSQALDSSVPEEDLQFDAAFADPPNLDGKLVELLDELDTSPAAEEGATVKYFEWHPLPDRNEK